MELRVLKYFLMVAREENITKAAELLHVTQPTLSRQLAQLEDELGVKLFERGQHGMAYTPTGADADCDIRDGLGTARGWSYRRDPTRRRSLV